MYEGMEVTDRGLEFNSVVNAQQFIYNEDPIEDQITEHTRWSVHTRAIYGWGGKFYEARYSQGATEYQMEEPFEYDKLPIVLREVRPVEKTVTVYE